MTRSSLLRPTLLPGLRPLWRDPHTVQLGTDPAQAVVLELPHPAAAKLLDLLDGAHTERAILAEMGRIGMSETDVQIVLGALSEAGLVVAAHSLLPSALPAEHRHRVAAEAAALALRVRDRAASPATILRRRYHCRVIIAGSGPFAPLLTSALLAAGIGTVGQVTEPGAAAVPVDPIPLAAALTPPPPTRHTTTASAANANGPAGKAQRGGGQGSAAASAQNGAADAGQEGSPGDTAQRSAGGSSAAGSRQGDPGGASDRDAASSRKGGPSGASDRDAASPRKGGPSGGSDRDAASSRKGGPGGAGDRDAASSRKGGAGDRGADAEGEGRGEGPSGRARTMRGDDAFVVQIGPMGRVSVRGSRRRRPLLALSVRDGVAIVGPLVPAAGGPCLRCLDLHRTDRDPAWPRLAAQLAQQDTDLVPCAAATILSAAGLAAAEILAYLDGGEPSTIGSTVEINGVGPWRRRSWAPHAACDCTRRR